MDLMNCCRICIQSNSDMRSINEIDICGKMKIVDKIIMCATVTAKDWKNIPEKICLKCLEDLHIAYRFKMNCETAETILKSLYDGQVITDLIMSSENGEIFKYEPPKGLRVKRIIKGQIENQLQQITTIKSEVDLSIGSSNIDISNIGTSCTNDGEETIYINANEYDDSYIQEENDDDDDDDDDDDGDGEGDEHFNNNEYSGVPQQIKIEYLDNEAIIEYDNQQLRTEEIQQKHDSIVSTKSKKEKKNKQKVPKNERGKLHDKTTEFRGRKPTADELKTIKICDICGNTYKYKHALESHMRRHRNEKPFSCEICGRSFVINFELRRHMRTHTGQKPYACQFCDRRFSDFGSRIKHERTHTGERPYRCDTCGKCFAYSHVLSSHVLIHTGEKRYGCEECGKRFTKSHHLKAHKNTHYKSQKTCWIEPETPFILDSTDIDKQEIVLSQNDEVISVLTTEDNESKPTTTMFMDADGKILTQDIKIIYN